MSVLFSKVALLSDDCTSTTEFLACGIPEDRDDLENYVSYQEFLEAHPDSECIDVTVNSFVYGEGETKDANIYEIASFTQRGEKFFDNPNVQLVGRSDFEIVNDFKNNFELEC